MSIRPTFEVQGHRGALGLCAENTLPGFEVALDVGATSIETDVHLTRDDVPVLFHDARITDRLCGIRPGFPVPLVEAQPLLRALTLQELRGYCVGGRLAPRVDSARGACGLLSADRFAQERGLDPYGIPTVTEFFEFIAAYAADAAKSNAQRDRARWLIFDLELKRVPFTPETIGDGFTGTAPAALERAVMAAIHSASVMDRVRVRCFDHRSVRAIKQIEPKLQTAALTYETAPVDIAVMLNAADADVYCPHFLFVDAEVVRQVHAVGKRIIPYTVNEPQDWRRLIDWGVDGITTDYPDRLVSWLASAEA